VKFLPLRNRKMIVLITLLLIIISIFAHLIQEGFGASIQSQGMIPLAKEAWDNGEYSRSIYWYHASYSSALMGGLRWEIYKIYSYRIGKYREQGNLSDALDMCWQATKVWNQEGAVSYECLSIEQEMLTQK